MAEVVKFLSDNGITFTNGAYTTKIQIAKAGLGTDDLFVHYVYPGFGHPKAARYTVNNTPIPGKVMEEMEWCYGPRGTVNQLQGVLEEIYVENKIEALDKEIEFLKKGKCNIETIVKGVLGHEIPLPESFSTEGVEKVLAELNTDVSLGPSIRKKEILKEKKYFDVHINSDQREKILSMKPEEIAEEWKYRMPKTKSLSV